MVESCTAIHITQDKVDQWDGGGGGGSGVGWYMVWVKRTPNFSSAQGAFIQRGWMDLSVSKAAQAWWGEWLR